ncbi:MULTISPECIES: hypothetical protein [Halocynthiibacter]|uniref:Uncharacterized protein n=1 Tax=Halocynthiibacter halioticoli TaxID=2986804 RepID=A0AAE3J0Z3_9RHOB|nr:MULTISPECIES: hypothetical protein [Halocynthiibacter]MCV6825783.1 hypothetical protein [Halocynthiibacter halioticoli]MCW4058784.1 hypothetical protein [Halocynthiibacter sp. SDUM655004]
MGAVPKVVILGLGIGLLANGVHLIVASRRKTVREFEVIWFSIGDFGWWLATLALIVTNFWITTTWGIAAAVIVATFVAGLGVAQLWTCGLQAHGHTSKQHFRAIVTSWLALPLWVRLWLVLLNGVFIAAFALLPDRIGEVTLLAYLATAPLLAGQVGYDGGLRRILGLAHLVPWIPLLAWLVFIPDRSAYSMLLSLTVAICLAFDVNDLRLFFQGDRAVAGKHPSRTA